MRTRTAVVAIALAISSHALGQALHAHWEPYQNASTPPSVDQELTDPVLVGAIDLHAQGIDEHALDVMFKDNPARLLGLPTR
jgi:predicted metal-dependent phosphotriesterase family hydrolase